MIVDDDYDDEGKKYLHLGCQYWFDGLSFDGDGRGGKRVRREDGPQDDEDKFWVKYIIILSQ